MNSRICLERISNGTRTNFTGTLERSTQYEMRVRLDGTAAECNFRSNGKDDVWVDEIGVEWRVVNVVADVR